MDDPRSFVLALCAFVILATVLIWAASGAFGAAEAAPPTHAQSGKEHG